MPKCPFLQSVIMDSIVGLMNHLLEMPTYCILSWYLRTTKETKHAEYFPMIIFLVLLVHRYFYFYIDIVYRYHVS